MTWLYLIRHGETQWNVEGRYQGQADPPLNALGLKQAHQLAQALRSEGLQVLFSSPLRRAAQTAEVIAGELHIPLYYEPRLMEIHQGVWQTRLRSEIQQQYADLFRRWETQPWEVAPPGGEHLLQVQERVFAAVEQIIARYPRHRVGLVTHRIPIALLKIRYQGLDPDIVRTIHLPNTYWEALLIDESRTSHS